MADRLPGLSFGTHESLYCKNWFLEWSRMHADITLSASPLGLWPIKLPAKNKAPSEAGDENCIPNTFFDATETDEKRSIFAFRHSSAFKSRYKLAEERKNLKISSSSGKLRLFSSNISSILDCSAVS